MAVHTVMIYVPDPVPVLFPLPQASSLYLRTIFRSALLSYPNPYVVGSVLREGGVTPGMYVGKPEEWFDDNRAAEWAMGQLLQYADEAVKYGPDTLMGSFYDEKAVPIAIAKYEQLYDAPYTEPIR